MKTSVKKKNKLDRKKTITIAVICCALAVLSILGIVLYNVARQEGLLTTPEQLEEEITRMEKISSMNNYARTNPTAQMNISVRLHNQRALEWLRAHNRFEEV